jgi:hypothetical protein
MWVPTKELMDVLGTSRLTTLVKPLHLPVCIDLSRSECRKYYAYAVDLGRSLKDLPEYLALMRPALGVWELGWAEHMREADGLLRWDITKSGIKNIKNGTIAKLALSNKPYGQN